MFLSLKTLYRKRTVIWPFYFYTIIRTLSTFYSSMFKLRDQWELDEGEIVGGKTGYTDEAGLCLASEAIVNGRKYIAITVNAEGNHNTEPFHVNDAFYLYNQLQSQ